METFGQELVTRFFDRVHGYVRMRVPQQDCEDLVSDIFLRAIQRQSQLRGDAGPWLFSIARTRIADYFREKKGRENKEQTMPIESTTEEAGGVSAAAPVSLAPLERLEHSEFNARLHRNLNSLSELERDVIALKFTDGLSNTEIAAYLNITPNHLGVVLHRALRQLRGAMLKEI